LQILFIIWADFKSLGAAKFVITSYSEKVKDPKKALNDGVFREGFDYEGVEHITDSSIVRISVNPNGKISKDTLN
jgi:hypothetical protein